MVCSLRIIIYFPNFSTISIDGQRKNEAGSLVFEEIIYQL